MQLFYEEIKLAESRNTYYFEIEVHCFRINREKAAIAFATT